MSDVDAFKEIMQNELLPQSIAAAQEISVAYLGASVNDGRMDALALGDSLRGFGRLTNRVSYLAFGARYDHRLEVDSGFRQGSLIVPLHIISEVVNSARTWLDSKGAQELSTLMSILGWGAVPGTVSVFLLFRRKKGRPISSQDDLDKLLAGQLDIDRALFIRIFNDREVQAAVRAVLRALRKEGIDEIQTRSQGGTIERVNKQDVIDADSAEKESVEIEEEKFLDIEKVALLPRLAWHFSDMGRPFDAQVQDPDLWSRVAKGERFGYGDKMKVLLRTEIRQDANGRLSYVRTIPNVLEVEHAELAQLPLFPEDTPVSKI